jgi:hypothetical protein
MPTINQFKYLTDGERELLFKAPVLVSVLASCTFNEVNEARKADAIKLAHLKTFTASPLLLPYYAEVEKCFKAQFEAEIEKYFPFDDTKRIVLKKELDNVNCLIGKLEKEYAAAMRKSLSRYSAHVKKATHSVFQDFLFPLPISGLTD